MNTTAAGLARMLLEHVRRAGVVDVDLLGIDPSAALAADGSITVSWVPADRLPADCSIAATYDKSTTPARISVASDSSPGRRRFSLLHEYGHHVRNQVAEVIQALFDARGRSAGIEEKMCDAFASFVLIPESIRNAAFASGVTAEAIAELMSSSSASEQAVAVAAAEAMSEPGYVVLLNAAAEAEFAARSGDVFPIRRGTPQTGAMKRAAAGIRMRGIAALDRGSGVMTRELHVDTAVAPRCVVAVAVDGPAPWTSFSGGRSLYSAPVEGWCEDCSQSFTTFTPGCRECGDPRCPDCGRCSCRISEVAGERPCEGCFTMQPPAAFASATTKHCRDCE